MNTTTVKWTDPATGGEYSAHVRRNPDWSGPAVLVVVHDEDKRERISMPGGLLKALVDVLGKRGRR